MSVTRHSNVPEGTLSTQPECNPDTVGFKMTQTMELHFEEYKFSLYFVGYRDPIEIPNNPTERIQYVFSQQGVVELTHNWKTEDDPNCKYHNGNDSPQGFGHIGITVPDVYAACKRFEDLGVQFRKKPDDGNMKGLAFILDPEFLTLSSHSEYWFLLGNTTDGYSIEVLSANQMAKDPMIVRAAVLPTTTSSA